MEELTFYWLTKEPYTLPASWKTIIEELTDGTREVVSYGPLFYSVPNRISQNALGNELLLYNQADGTGSSREDVIAVYGKPLYEGIDPDTGGSALYYRYLNVDLPEDEILYVRFEFSVTKTNCKLGAIMVSNAENFLDDPYTEAR